MTHPPSLGSSFVDVVVNSKMAKKTFFLIFCAIRPRIAFSYIRKALWVTYDQSVRSGKQRS